LEQREIAQFATVCLSHPVPQAGMIGQDQQKDSHHDLPSDLSPLYNMLQLQLAKEENWSQKRAFIIILEKLRTNGRGT
jgi:hypothetical protein